MKTPCESVLEKLEKAFGPMSYTVREVYDLLCDCSVRPEEKHFLERAKIECISAYYQREIGAMCLGAIINDRLRRQCERLLTNRIE